MYIFSFFKVDGIICHFGNIIAQSRLLERLSSLLPEEMRGEHTEAAFGLFLILLIASIIHLVIRYWIVHLLHKLDEKTTSEWYAVILRHKLPQRALFMVPLLIIYKELI